MKYYGLWIILRFLLLDCLYVRPAHKVVTQTEIRNVRSTLEDVQSKLYSTLFKTVLKLYGSSPEF